MTRFGGQQYQSPITYEKMAQDDWGEPSTLYTKAMLLPNSEFCPDANKHRAYRACIQATNIRFSNRRLPLHQFGNSIVLVEYLGLGFQACD